MAMLSKTNNFLPVQKKQDTQAAQHSQVGPTRVTRLGACATPFDDLGRIQSGSLVQLRCPCFIYEHPLGVSEIMSPILQFSAIHSEFCKPCVITAAR